jgi:hypothetical protein
MAGLIIDMGVFTGLCFPEFFPEICYLREGLLFGRFFKLSFFDRVTQRAG